MRNPPSRWLVVALAGLASQWPGVAPGQNGAPIPLLPPTVTAPPTYEAAPAPPYQAAPAAPYQATPSTPYQEAPTTPPSEQSVPIVATPLAPPIPPTPPASSTTPPASTPTASAPSATSAPASTSAGPAPAAPAPAAEAPAQAAETPAPAEPSPPEAPPEYPNNWVPETTARLIVLNKIDALSKDLTVKVGQSASYGPLTITVQSCLVRPPDQPANATAFLVINDSHNDEPGFRGWTLANDPWLSMLQNPVYDVWVAGCQP